MEKNGFLSEKSLQTVKSLKKTFLWVAVWILIGELVAGAMIILTQAWTDLVGKVQLSFLVVAVMLFIGVNNFVRIEKGDKTIQGFALVGLICNILWAVICLMLMWEILPSAVEYVSSTNTYNCTHGGSLNCVSYGPSIFLKTLLVALSATTGCFWISIPELHFRKTDHLECVLSTDKQKALTLFQCYGSSVHQTWKASRTPSKHCVLKSTEGFPGGPVIKTLCS